MSENNVSANEDFIKYRDSLLRESEKLLNDTKSLSIKHNGRDFRELLEILIKAVKEAQDFSSLGVYARDFKLLMDYFKNRETEKPFARFMNFINEYVDFDIIKKDVEDSKVASKVVSLIGGGVKTYVAHMNKIEKMIDQSSQKVKNIQNDMFEYGKNKGKEDDKQDTIKHMPKKQEEENTTNAQNLNLNSEDTVKDNVKFVDLDFKKIKDAALKEAQEFLDGIPNWPRNKKYRADAEAYVNYIKNAGSSDTLEIYHKNLRLLIEKFIKEDFSRMPVKIANAVKNLDVKVIVTAIAGAGTVFTAAFAAAATVGGYITAGIAGITLLGYTGLKVYSNYINKIKENMDQILGKVQKTQEDITEYRKKEIAKQKNKQKEKVSDKQHTQTKSELDIKKEDEPTRSIKAIKVESLQDKRIKRRVRVRRRVLKNAQTDKVNVVQTTQTRVEKFVQTERVQIQAENKQSIKIESATNQIGNEQSFKTKDMQVQTESEQATKKSSVEIKAKNGENTKIKNLGTQIKVEQSTQIGNEKAQKINGKFTKMEDAQTQQESEQTTKKVSVEVQEKSEQPTIHEPNKTNDSGKHIRTHIIKNKLEKAENGQKVNDEQITSTESKQVDSKMYNQVNSDIELINKIKKMTLNRAEINEDKKQPLLKSKMQNNGSILQKKKKRKKKNQNQGQKLSPRR